MNVIPFEPWHVSKLRLQTEHIAEMSIMGDSYLKVLKASGPAITAERDGIIYACGGIAMSGPAHGLMWSFISLDSGPYFVRMHKIAERLMDCCRLQRLEATVLAGFKPGCRWLELLKFKYEGEMPGFGINGETHLRYGRVWLPQ